MDLIGDFRNLLAKGRKALGIEADTPAAHPVPEQDDPLRPAPPEAETDPAAQSGRMRLKLVPESRLAQDSILNSMRDLKMQLEQQWQSAREVMQQLRQLPEDVRQMPELAQENARTLQSICDRLDQAQGRNQALDAALEQAKDVIDEHAELAGLLRQQLDSSGRTSLQLMETIESIEPRLTEFSQSQKQLHETLAQLTSHSASAQTHAAEQVRQLQQRMTLVMILSSIAAIAALGAVVLVLIL